MRFLSSMANVVRLALFAIVLASAGVAGAAETPPTLAGAKTVTAEEVKGLIGKAAILDVRKKASFLEGHIPTGISIKHAQNKDTKKFDLAVFGTDKGAAIIIHGHGSDGWSAVEAVNSAVEAGYTNVLWFRGGIREWTEKGNALAS